MKRFEVTIDIVEDAPPQMDSASSPGISEVEQQLPPEQTPTQEELFGAHVASVYEHGDAIDRLRFLRWRSTIMRAGVPTAVTTEALAATNPTAGAAFGLAVGVASVASVAGYSKIKNKRDSDRAREQLAHDTQDALGEAYELYRPKSRLGSEPKPLELVWYSPMPKKDAPDAPDQDMTYRQHLVKMATLAQSQGIEKMHVDDSALFGLQMEAGSAGKPDAADIRGEREPAHMIKAVKGIGVRVAAHEIATRSPEEWLAYAEALAPVVEDLNKFKAIAALVPNHPLSRIVTELQEDPELMMKELRRKTARELDDDMVRYDVRPNAALKGIPVSQDVQGEQIKNDDAERTGNPNLIRKSVAFQETGTVKGGKSVEWHTAYGKEVQGVDAATGISAEMISALLENPDINPSQANKAVELAFYKLVHKQEVTVPKVKQEDKKQEVPLPANATRMPTMAQDVLIAPKDKKGNFVPRKYRQLVGGVAVMGLALTGGIIGHGAIDDFRNRQVASVKGEMAQERGVHPVDILTSDARKETENRYPDMWLWGKLTDGEKFLADTLPSLSFNNGSSDERPLSWSQSNDDETTPANSGNDDKPMFDIQSHGGMSTEGYWASTTSNQMLIKRDQHGNIFPTWAAETKPLHTTPQLPKSLPKNYKDKQWLRVDHELAAHETKPYGESEYNKLNIPVLEGTKPVAATMDGEGVRLIEKTDHTYMALTRDEDTRKITYWLVPDKGNKPTFQRPIELLDDKFPGKAGKQWLEANKGLLAKTMQQNGQLDPNLTGDDAINGAAQALKEGWKYSTEPLDEEKYYNMKQYEDFVEMTTDAKTADCEVANTLVAMSKYDKSNIVNGFRNAKGDGNDTLSEQEGHEWRTDGDATPYATGKRAEASDTNSYGVVREAVIGAAAMGAGGASLALGFGLGTLAAPAWHRRKLRPKSGAFNDAMAAAEVALYAPSFTDEAYKARKDALANAKSTVEPDTLVASRPDLFSKHTAAILKEVAKTLPKNATTAKELKSSTAILTAGDNVVTSTQRADQLRTKLRQIRRITS
jgi:hypothetical protein